MAGRRRPSGSPEQLEAYVTRWGFDPVTAWSSSPNPDPPMPSHPTPSNFPLATGGVQNLTLAERPQDTVHIAPHDVAFDTERKLWFCDIELGFGHGERT